MDKIASSAAEYIQFTLTLVIGSLGFTMGLIIKPLDLPRYGKWLLVISTIFLFISIVAGMGAWSGIPQMMETNTFSLKDPLFLALGKIHQLSFVLGIACVAIALLTHYLRKEKSTNKNQTNHKNVQEKSE
jgi:hypothetical protein